MTGQAAKQLHFCVLCNKFGVLSVFQYGGWESMHCIDWCNIQIMKILIVDVFQFSIVLFSYLAIPCEAIWFDYQYSWKVAGDCIFLNETWILYRGLIKSYYSKHIIFLKMSYQERAADKLQGLSWSKFVIFSRCHRPKPCCGLRLAQRDVIPWSQFWMTRSRL